MENMLKICLFVISIITVATVESKFANTIFIDPIIKYQTMEGFGMALTGGSAQVIWEMADSDRSLLLNELFGLPSNGSL
jgi:glucosylceramidase